MAVFWTIQARRHLRQALARALGRESDEANAGTGVGKAAGKRSGLCLNVLDATMERLDDILAATFPGMSVVVKDHVLGYRRKEDLFILMVESFGKDDTQETGPFVVKIGRESRIKKEIAGWKCCCPPGLKHDLVFLDLRAGERHDVDGEAWMSLVYGDAQQFLGVTVTVPFEEAALECIRSGFPRLLSIGFVIIELFERIGHLLYSQGFVDDPALPDFMLSLPKLENALQRWETEPSCQTARRDVNALAASGVERFLDPIDYLRYVQAYVPWKDVKPEGTTETPSPTEIAEASQPASLPRPAVIDLVPRMLRGCAHGDLHGRNILVGIVRDQAMWPTVFDYEDMGPSNLIGWDFVKLETELKLRAYLDVFGGGSPARFVQQVQRFEVRLNAMTEDCHRNRSWPDAVDPATQDERLQSILMLIRRMAAHHLGVNHGRPNDWLEEYYFLLACYGTFTARFENLQPRERIGALLSAGVATSRLSWPRRLG